MEGLFLSAIDLHAVNDIKHTDIHTAEPLVPEPSAFEVEMAIEKLKRHKSPGIDQIPAELIKSGCRKICYQIHKLINPIWNKEELLEEWKESIIAPIYKKGDKADCNNYRGISLLSSTYKILSNFLLSRLTPYAEAIIGHHQCGIDATGQLLEKKKWEYNEVVHKLFIDFKKAFEDPGIDGG